MKNGNFNTGYPLRHRWLPV